MTQTQANAAAAEIAVRWAAIAETKRSRTLEMIVLAVLNPLVQGLPLLRPPLDTFRCECHNSDCPHCTHGVPQ